MNWLHTIGTISVNEHWLTTANLVLAALLLLWMLRAVRLVRTSAERDQQNIATIQNLAEGVYRTSPEGRQLFANASLVKLNGYETERELLDAVNDIGKEWYVDPTRRNHFKDLMERNGEVRDFVSEIYRHKTRERIWIAENARVVTNPATGRTLYYEGSVRDITREIEAKKIEQRLEKLAQNLSGGLFQMTGDSSVGFVCNYASPGFIKLLELDPDEELVDFRKCINKIHRDDRSAYLAQFEKSARALTTFSAEMRYTLGEDRVIWLNVNATPEILTNGRTLWHGHVNDITTRKLAEQQVNQLAFVDTLTDLPNRRVFMDRLERMISACKRRSEHGAILFIDLDNFKSLNDTHGHEKGDELLRLVAERLRKSVRATDTVSRFGGDEFALLLDSLGSDMSDAIANATGAANKILREFANGFDLGTVEHQTTPSIGVVVFDGAERSPADVLKSADIAMYEAKKGGRNNYMLFDPTSLDDVSEKYLLQRDLSAAIRNNELVFEFQPQVDVNGKVLGAEALVRWQHPERGLLGPSEFVPMAEKTGLIMEINEWVLENAIKTLARWSAVPALSGISLSVNLSVQQFRSPNFVARLADQIEKSGINATLLTLELTEHIMARNPEKVAEHMTALKECGIRFSLDDFGTGYSSLSQLNQFPFDEVKIDGAFVSDIEHRESNRTLIEAILGMARALNLETVAEHVGSPNQVEFLRERGCNLFQGFFFHPPLPEVQLEDLLVAQQPQARALRVASA
ncbi:MAG: EAL domain-containing protein [Rhizobiaceae bacterium]